MMFYVLFRNFYTVSTPKSSVIYPIGSKCSCNNVTVYTIIINRLHFEHFTLSPNTEMSDFQNNFNMLNCKKFEVQTPTMSERVESEIFDPMYIIIMKCNRCIIAWNIAVITVSTRLKISIY